MKIDFLKEQYTFELERRQQLTTSLTIPVTVLIILGGGLGVFAKELSYQSKPLSITFIILIAIAAAAFGETIFFLIRSYHGHIYLYIPRPGEQKAHLDELMQYYQKLNAHNQRTRRDVLVLDSEEVKKKVDGDFQAFLERRYIEATDYNWWNNHSKSENLHRANTWLIVVLITTIFCSILPN
jgi:hypothetical protein